MGLLAMVNGPLSLTIRLRRVDGWRQIPVVLR
jgi:hypothetical protein